MTTAAVTAQPVTVKTATWATCADCGEITRTAGMTTHNGTRYCPRCA